MKTMKTTLFLRALIALIWFSLAGSGLAQSLVVDQASGPFPSPVLDGVTIPQNQIAQSFTPTFSAVGWVQLNETVLNLVGNDTVTLVVNLREGSWDGPVVSSTDPVVLMNYGQRVGTFYFPANVPVVPDQLYFFEPIVMSGGILTVGHYNSSTYDRGQSWGNGLPGVTDLWFREGIVIPEPGTQVLILVGLTGFVARLRGRKKI